eukprot:14185997-Ditylum_brightwellii.AAC.1
MPVCPTSFLIELPSREAFSIPLRGMTCVGNVICPFMFPHLVATSPPRLPDAAPCTTAALE